MSHIRTEGNVIFHNPRDIGFPKRFLFIEIKYFYEFPTGIWKVQNISNGFL